MDNLQTDIEGSVLHMVQNLVWDIFYINSHDFLKLHTIMFHEENAFENHDISSSSVINGDNGFSIN